MSVTGPTFTGVDVDQRPCGHVSGSHVHFPAAWSGRSDAPQSTRQPQVIGVTVSGRPQNPPRSDVPGMAARTSDGHPAQIAARRAASVGSAGGQVSQRRAPSIAAHALVMGDDTQRVRRAYQLVRGSEVGSHPRTRRTRRWTGGRCRRRTRTNAGCRSGLPRRFRACS